MDLETETAPPETSQHSASAFRSYKSLNVDTGNKESTLTSSHPHGLFYHASGENPSHE